MPRASRYHLTDAKFKEMSDHFSSLIASLTSREETEKFLNEFLTYEEKVMLTKRLILYMMLQQDYEKRAIKEMLHISHETIRLYAYQYPQKSSFFHNTIEKLAQREKTKQIWQKLNAVLKPLDLALRSKNDMKARAKFASGDWE